MTHTTGKDTDSKSDREPDSDSAPDTDTGIASGNESAPNSDSEGSSVSANIQPGPFDDIDPLDFSYLDTLRKISLLEGRITLGALADKSANRPLLLFVHGAYHGAWCYTSYLRYFDRVGIPAAALDLQGHGGLPQNADFPTLGVGDFSRTVLEACRAIPNPVILFGHSLGALIAALAASQFRVHGLGLLAPSPPGQLVGAKAVPLLDESALAPVPVERVCQRVFLPGRPREAFLNYHQQLCPESAVALNDRYGLRVDVPVMTLPSICIAAANDSPITHPEGQDKAVADFYGAEFMVLENAAHCFMLTEDWLPSAELIRDWYGRNFAQKQT